MYPSNLDIFLLIAEYYYVQIIFTMRFRFFFLYFEVHILSYPETQFGLELMGKMKNPLKRKLSWLINVYEDLQC